MERVYIGIGSNLGDRAWSLFEGVRLLVDAVGARVRLSPLYETEPLDYLDQPRFLNGVVELAGALPEPEALLDACLAVEARLGRVRGVAKGPRPLDLDMLLYGDRRVESPRLTLPHPRMHERRFVLAPLVDLAPDVRHPVLGRTAAGLLAALTDNPAGVTRI